MSFEEWLKLNDEEKGKKYKELSDGDKFRVRQGDYFSNVPEQTVVQTDFIKEINALYKEILKEKNDENTIK